MKPTMLNVFTALLQNIEELDKREEDPIKRTFYISAKVILEAIRRDWDDIAAFRFEEIDTISSFLLRGAGLAPAEIGSTLAEVAASSLRAKEIPKISALDESIDSLRNELINLQTWLEEQTSLEAKILQEDIMAFLYKNAQKRAAVEYYQY